MVDLIGWLLAANLATSIITDLRVQKMQAKLKVLMDCMIEEVK